MSDLLERAFPELAARIRERDRRRRRLLSVLGAVLAFVACAWLAWRLS